MSITKLCITVAALSLLSLTATAGSAVRNAASTGHSSTPKTQGAESAIPDTVYVTSLGEGEWTVPANVYKVKVYVTGGGGTGDGADDAQNSWVQYGAHRMTGGKGRGGNNRGFYPGGTASGGDINIRGGVARGGRGGSSYWSKGETGGWGAGGYRDGEPGSAAGTAIKTFNVTPGQKFSYYVGSRNMRFPANSGVMSGHGVVVFEY